VIALDTNVLLRLVVKDDEAQAEAALRLIEKLARNGEAAFVALITLVEFAWVLEDAYGVRPREISSIIREILSISTLVVERETMVLDALDADQGDLSDRLIHFAGVAAGCDRTVTFDRKTARLSGVELLDVAKS
jgi:predicted nucleic-acid-binding protein